MAQTPQCPYTILSVSRESSEEDIKKAYRKLAIVHHPDKNQGSVEATQMFQKISGAYAILSDPEKRQHYDMTGSLDEDEMGAPDMDDFMQMFFQNLGGGMMFGGGRDMFFDFGGRRGDPFMSHGGFGSFGGYSDPFADFYDDDDSEFDSMYEEDLMAEEYMEVVPALFCSKFIEIQEPEKPLPSATPAPTTAGKMKKAKETYKCTLCQAVMKTPDSAENHFINTHSILFGTFFEILMEEGLEADVEALFEGFAADILSGKISEKKKKKKRPKRKSGPRVKAPSARRN